MTAQDALATAALATAPMLAGLASHRAVAVPGTASPSYHGVESTSYIVTAGEASYFLKVAERESAALIDVPASFRAARQVAALGLAPAPLHLAEAQGAILFEHLGPDWRPARLDDLTDPVKLQTVIAAFARVAAGPGFGRSWTVFDGIAGLREMLGDADTLPPDAGWLFEEVGAIEAAFAAAGSDRAACHADPHATNLMFGSGGVLRLVDFDMACDTDPHYQLAALLNEACQFDSEMAAGIEMAVGHACTRVFARCRAYAAADDLHWALRALTMDRLSPRTELEFRKYANWRLLRLRMRVGQPGFEETLRSL